uniref:DUF4817 domain-containing protein n=1 Tax=Mastacembelus armatus TaxID=205130 RepID=A0A3Q3KZL0_9TELE
MVAISKSAILDPTFFSIGRGSCDTSNLLGISQEKQWCAWFELFTSFSLFTAIDMSKRLTRDERIEIVLISGERSNRVIAADFNARHPTRPPISHATVSKLLAKFRETGSVLDLPKCGRMKTVTNEQTSVAVLASFSKSPQRSTRRMSLESGISRTSLRRILATHKLHPYKLQLLQHLNEDDPDRRTQFAEWAKQKLEQDPQFTQKILFSDEANFYVNGEVNKQNHRYWSDTNPHWIDPSKTVGTKKVMVWCGIWGTKIVGPFFINGNLKATGYLKLLHDVFPSLCTEAGTFPEFFQQDGAPPHYGCQVRAFLDEQFPEKWIGRRGPVERPPRSPDLTPLDFYLWGHLKAIVYGVKIRDVQHLKLRILEACAGISPVVLLSVCEEWEKRVALTIHHNGQHIEHIL